jgi:hypothetical protein
MPYRSEKRLYLTADGRVVEEGDPDAASLLVNAGGELDDATAERYGLTKPAEGEKGKAAPANKALAAPENKAPAEKPKR